MLPITLLQVHVAGRYSIASMSGPYDAKLDLYLLVFSSCIMEAARPAVKYAGWVRGGILACETGLGQ